MAVFPALPKIPAPDRRLVIAAAIATAGLSVLSPTPLIRAIALSGLTGCGAIVHRRLSGKQTAKVLALAEGKWSEDLIAARAAGLAEGKASERTAARDWAQAYAAETIGKAQDEMIGGYRLMEQELAAAVALKDRAIATAKHHRDRAAAIESQIESANRRFAETQAQLELERDRLDVSKAQFKLEIAGEISRLEQERDRAIEQAAAAADHAAALEQALAQQQQAAHEAITQALTQQQQSHALEVAKLKTQLAEFTAGREAIARRRAAEAKLVTLSEVLDRFGPKPVFVAGPEGAGKGTTIVSYLRALAEKFGAVVPVVFDPSEDRLWELTGIPVTSNRALFFELIELTLKRAKSTRVDRTQADRFSQQAPIVFVIDESASLYAGLKQDEINHYQTLLDQLRTRGNKYGLIPIFTAISEQIQNLKSNGKQILNGGTIAPMLRIWLNGVLDEYCCRFSGQVGDDLRDWLAVSEGEYRAAMVTTDGGAKVLIPMQHPSHHAQILGEKEPTIPVTGPAICPPPDYWPLAAKILFSCSHSEGDTLEPARELATASYQKTVSLSPLATAIFNFAVASNEPITVNKFKRFGSKFYKGASRLDAAEIDRAIEELIGAEMVLIEPQPNGGRVIRVSTVA